AKYVSLKADDPYTVTLERALEVIREKQIADANRLIMDFPDAGIQVLNGRYGPYITDKQRNAKIPKDKNPKSLTLPECQAILAAAPVRTFGRWGRKNAHGAAKGAAVKGAAKGARGKGGARDKPPPADTPPAARLAAKGSKPAAKKRAPAEPKARPRSKAAARSQGLKRKKA
ncbi:MAG: topoisomerase C-terminal repeat-containing protein, partial [Steroidobacteraceae bacterium]